MTPWPASKTAPTGRAWGSDMTAALLRLLISLVIVAIIYFGVRKIWTDWTRQFRAEDKAANDKARQRDLNERAKPGVIDLKRNKDGVFRPGDEDKR